MALYFLPQIKDRHVARPSKALAKSGFATENFLTIPELNTASNSGAATRFTRWKALHVESIKGVIRLM